MALTAGLPLRTTWSTTPSSSKRRVALQAVHRRALNADGRCAVHERAWEAIKRNTQSKASAQLRPPWQDRLPTLAPDPVRLRLQDQLQRAKLAATNTLQRSPPAS